MNVVIKNDKFLSILNNLNISEDIEYFHIKFNQELVTIQIITFNYICLLVYKLNINSFDVYDIKNDKEFVIYYELLYNLVKINEDNITTFTNIDDQIIINIPTLDGDIQIEHENLKDFQLSSFDIPSKKINYTKINIQLLKQLYAIHKIKECSVLNIKMNKNSNTIIFTYEDQKNIFKLMYSVKCKNKNKTTIEIKLSNEIIYHILSTVKNDIIHIMIDKHEDLPYVIYNETEHGNLYFYISNID
tara:strand:- start:198 stop:932 length:735 start_codon:yes stop_codon:yes gene_type:complete